MIDTNARPVIKHAADYKSAVSRPEIRLAAIGERRKTDEVRVMASD